MCHFNFIEKLSALKTPELELRPGKIATENGTEIFDEFTCAFVKKHMKFIDRFSFEKVVIATMYGQDILLGEHAEKLKNMKWKFKINLD